MATLVPINGFDVGKEGEWRVRSTNELITYLPWSRLGPQPNGGDNTNYLTIDFKWKGEDIGFFDYAHNNYGQVICQKQVLGKSFLFADKQVFTLTLLNL